MIGVNYLPSTLGTLVLALIVSGCASDRGIGSQQQPHDPAMLVSAQSLQAQLGTWPDERWWESFGSAELNQLVSEALANNPRLADAAARLAAANAALEGAQATLAPRVDANASANWQRYTENGVYSEALAGSFKASGALNLNASYDLDFWGRNRAAVAAGQSREQAAAAEVINARLLLAASVTKAWIQLARLQEFRRIGATALVQRTQIVELTQQRVAAGLDTQVELKQAEMQVPLTRGLLVALDESIINTRHAIAELLGAGPDRTLNLNAPLPPQEQRLSAHAPAELPAELLGRRPDIVAARWRVEAALRDTDASRAEFYPNINLSAFVGYSSVGLDRLLRSGSRIYGGGPALSLPVFDGGRLRANLKSDYAAYDSAVANYNETLVHALRDVADQLNGYRLLQPQIDDQQAGLAAAQGAFDLALVRYRAGIGNYLTVLNAQTSVIGQQLYGAHLQARAQLLQVELARALGGGYRSETSEFNGVAQARRAGENHD